MKPKAVCTVILSNVRNNLVNKLSVAVIYLIIAISLIRIT